MRRRSFKKRRRSSFKRRGKPQYVKLSRGGIRL